MISFDVPSMRSEARTALVGAAVSPKKLIMVHSGVTIGLGLVLSVLSYLLGLGIDETGGLSGIGMRAVLETVQTVLQMANLILVPFWAMGYIRAVLQWKDGTLVDSSTLFAGFRCWGAVLRCLLLQGVIYVALMILGMQLASFVFMLTPSAQAMYTLAEEMTAQGVTDITAMLESDAYQTATMAMLPYVLVGMLIFVIPAAWRLRFTDYALMDAPEAGALRAIRKSLRLTRKNFLPLLKLDLHFWWFYLAQGLIAVLGYGDLLLDMAGVELGMRADVAMFVFYIAALVCEFGLYVWKKNEVFVTYGLAYEQLATARGVPVAAPVQKKVPWNYGNTPEE